MSGQPISFSVVNELSPTTNAGPYSLNLYTDNPVITLKATQTGTAGSASFAYNWLNACNASARLGVRERSGGLLVQVLGNLVLGQLVAVEIRGAEGQSLRVELVDLQGRILHQQGINRAAVTEWVSVRWVRVKACSC